MSNTAKTLADGNNLRIYEYIGSTWFSEGITAKSISKALDEMSGDITVHINSKGGDVFESIAIGNLLKAYDGKCTAIIEGIAASGASAIAVMCDDVKMYKSAMQMVHRPHTEVYGNEEDIQSALDSLRKITGSFAEMYRGRFNGSDEEFEKIYNGETFLKAEDCLKYGLCDEIIDSENEEDIAATSNKVVAMREEQKRLVWDGIAALLDR